MGKHREVTVMHIMESDSQHWASNASGLTGGDPVETYVDIKDTKGTNTPEGEVKMISSTVEMLKNTIGVIQHACYVVIHDIPANSWGYDGKTQEARAVPKL